MSSQLEQTSSILGEYMLKGWTLTDLHCDQCNITPLMREPVAQAIAANRARIQFCAKCDGGPQGQNQAQPNAQSAPDLSSDNPRYDLMSPIDPHPPISSSSSIRSSSIRNRPPSVPPSQVLSTTPSSSERAAPQSGAVRNASGPLRLSPMTRTQQLPRASSPSAAQRTRTSEENSELISQKLLQGYSLLQSSCPNPQCEGIPLIGFPRAKDGMRDPRRMCVGCGTGYVSEGAMGGMRPVTPAAVTASGAMVNESEAGPSGSAGLGVMVSDIPRAAPESPRSKQRRELYETGEAINKTLRPATEVSTPNPRQSQSFSHSIPTESLSDENDDDLLSPLHPTSTQAPSASTANITSALNNVNTSLARTLDHLATSLSAQTSGAATGAEPRYFIDVKLHTEAIRDVLECVERVRRVQ